MASFTKLSTGETIRYSEKLRRKEMGGGTKQPYKPKKTESSSEPARLSLPSLSASGSDLNTGSTAPARLSLPSLDTRSALQQQKDTEYYRDLKARVAGLESARRAPDFASTAAQSRSGEGWGDVPKFGYGRLSNALNYFSIEGAPINEQDFRQVAARQQAMNQLSQSYKYGQMTDDEKNTMLYYVGRKEYDKAEDYLDALQRTLNARANGEFEKQVTALSQESPVFGAVGNVLTGLSSIPAALANAGQTVKNTVTGKYEPTDTNSDFFLGAKFQRGTSAGTQEAARQGAAKLFGNKTAGDAAAFLTGAGLSAGQSVLQGSVLGKVGGLASMGASAAGSSTLDSLERGASPNEALAAGAANGVIEAGTELLPLDRLFRVAKEGGRQSTKQIAKNLGRQMLAEGTGEAISEAAGNAVDRGVLGDRSEQRRYVRELMDQGMSQEEAERKAFVQFYGVNPFMAGVGGAISGGVMGAGAQAVAKAGYRGDVRRGIGDLSPEARTEIVNQGLKSDPKSTAYKLAVQAVNKSAAGGKVSDGELAKIFLANDKAGQFGGTEIPGLSLPTLDDIGWRKNKKGGEPKKLSLPTLEGMKSAIVSKAEAALNKDSKGLSLPVPESRKSGIVPDMDDNTRAEVLRGKTIAIPTYDSANEVTGAEIEQLKDMYTRDARKVLHALGEKCKVFDTPFRSEDVGLEFKFNNRSFKESINKQSEWNRINGGQSMQEFGRMLTILPDIIDGAIEIDARTDRYAETDRGDADLKEMHVLLGAFRDGNTVIPVKMEVKEFKDGSPKENRLYVAITMNEKEAGISPRSSASLEGPIRSTPASTATIADIAALVKDESGSLLKYIPDSLLSEEQIAVKQQAQEKLQQDLEQKHREYLAAQGIDPDSVWAQEGQFVRDRDEALDAAGLYGGDTLTESFPGSEHPQDGTVNPDDSVGAAPAGFDEWSKMLNGPLHPIGEDPKARLVDVPKQNLEGRNVPKSAATVMEAEVTPDQSVKDIMRAIMDGELAFDTITDESAGKWARDVVNEKGWERAVEQFHQDALRGVVSKNNIALGQVLLNNAMNAGDGKTAIEILTDYASMSTTSAQALQAQRMLKRLSPESQLYGLQRTVDNLQKKLNEEHGEKAPDVEIPPDLVDEFVKAPDQEGREKVKQKIVKAVAEQVPATWMDKWNAWRYMAMLCNPRTHVRNIAGNAFFWPVRYVKNAIATTIEGVADKVTPGGIERTKAFLNLASKGDRDLVRAALADVANVEDQLLGDGGKYTDAESEIEAEKPVFTSKHKPVETVLKPLEKLRKFNGTAMDVEDTWFSKPAYAGALAKFLKANGVTAQALRDGSADTALVDKGRAWAIQEAKKATYRDINALSEVISKMRFHPKADAALDTPLAKGVNRLEKGINILGEGVMPFRKTPANILARGLEYSPAGLFKGLADIRHVKSGEMSAAQVIDNISAGLTGTGLAVLGYFMAKWGLVTGGASADDEQDEQDELTGEQDFAMHIGKYNFTLDWLAPEAMPFFTGVETFNLFAKQTDVGATFKNALDGLSSITDPMLDLSMLQGLTDALESVKFNDSSLLPAVASNMAANYLSQAIPTLSGQIERVSETERKNTFIDWNSGLPNEMQRFLGKVMNKLPGDFQQVPYVDAWGRHEETGNLLERGFNNFINPAYSSKENVTEVDRELQRLHDAGQTGVFPSRVKQSTTVSYQENDEKLSRYLSADEFVEYATLKGRTSYDLVKKMLDNPLYLSMSDEDKAASVQGAYKYAGELAAKEIEARHSSPSYVAAAQAAEDELGLSEEEYLLLKTKYGSLLGQDDVRKAYREGVDPESFLEYKAGEKQYDQDGNGSVSIAERAEAMEKGGLSEKEQEAAWRAAKPEWVEKAEDVGVSFGELVQYKIIVNTAGATKKDEKIKALRAAGYSAAEASRLYKAVG